MKRRLWAVSICFVLLLLGLIGRL
ncbi:MAG: hypothetical protein K0Q48_2221, partial [Bacillota bacterium]|nr:hypothetical protein [Bacillota bacterium]